MHVRKNVLALLVFCSALCAYGVEAAEFTGSGDLTYITVDSETHERADGTVIARNHSKSVIRADDPSVPFHLATQDCIGTTVIRTDGGQAGSGYCDAVDKDGDVWWIWWRSNRNGSTWSFIDGTGKYEGIKGGGTTSIEAAYPDGRMAMTWNGSLILN